MISDTFKSFECSLMNVVENGDISCVIISNSSGHFMTGGKLKGKESHDSLRSGSLEEVSLYLYRLYRSFGILKCLDVPIVCAMHGKIVGASVGAMSWCDTRIATVSTEVDINFLRLGISFGVGASALLCNLCEWNAILTMSFLPNSSLNSLSLGLIDMVVPSKEECLRKSLDVAKRISLMSNA